MIKKYFALIHGNPRTNTGEFNQAIGRHPKVRVKMCVSEKGKSAITKWEVRERFNEGLSLVECRILTGRTHQIRVHFSHANHPIWGDSTYGGKTTAGVCLAQGSCFTLMKSLFLIHVNQNYLQSRLHTQMISKML